MKLVCHGKKCQDCKQHFKQWKTIQRFKRLHEFPECWAKVSSKEFLNSEWWQEFIWEWEQYFETWTHAPLQYNKEIVFAFPFYFSSDKPDSFYNVYWDDFKRAYSQYFSITDINTHLFNKINTK